MTQLAIDVEGVSKSFRLYHERNVSLKATVLRGRRAVYEEFWALRDVSLAVPAGATFGIVGNNGSGKSTLLKCITRILLPDRGRIRTVGKVSSLLELGSGFHPDLTGRENVYLNGAMLQMRRSDIDAKMDAIVDFADIGGFIDQPVNSYSSGMHVRLGFAVAIHVDPDILLVDEVISVGDAAFQERCLQKFAEFRRAGKTIVVAGHSVGVMAKMCDEVGRLDSGRLVEVGMPSDIIGKHIPSLGRLDPEQSSVSTMSGSVDVDVLMTDGSPASAVETGAAVTFRLRFDTEATIERPVFSIALDTAAGVCAWAQDSEGVAGMPQHAAGRGFMDLHIPRLSLQAGQYNLRVALTNAIGPTAQELRSVGRIFRVVNPGDDDPHGIAVLDGRWGPVVEVDDRVADRPGTNA